MRGGGALRRLLNFWPATGIIASVLLSAATAATAGSGPIGAVLAPIQERFFDTLLRFRQPRALDDPEKDPIVLIGLDEKSHRLYGNKPPRAVVAGILERASDAGARVIVLDLLFSEKDSGSMKVTEALASLQKSLSHPTKELQDKAAEIRERYDEDEQLAKALSATPTIEAYAGSAIADLAEKDSWKRIPEAEALHAEDCERAGKRTAGVILDDPIFFDAARVHASAYITPDLDGVVRRYPLFSHVAGSGSFFPSAGLLAAQIYLDEPPAEVGCAGSEVKYMTLGARDFTEVIDTQGLIRVNFGGRFGDSFPNYIPMKKVLEKNADGSWAVPDSRFAGKIVFIGERTDDDDRYTTPFETTFSGVGFHATVASNLVRQSWLRRQALAYQGFEALAGLLIGLLGVLGIVYFPRFAMLLVAAALFLIGILVSWLALSRGLLINGFFPGVVGTVSMLVTFSSRFFLAQTLADEEKKQREATQRELGRFLSPAIVDIALRDPNLLAPAKREISILFSDIRGFTTTAEGMSPEALVALLDGYLTKMTQIVFDEKGTLDKYIGDAVMALFGAPVSFEDHPVYACKAALDMMAALKVMQKEWEKTGQPILDIGIGINTGVVSVGRMGSSGKSEYTCLGDEVNFASRLEGLNKAYGTHILVGEATRQKAGDQFLYRDLGLVQVKGKKKATHVYELLAERKSGDALPAWMPVWDAALAAFLQRDWNAAEKLFAEVATARGGDPPSHTFLEFIEVFRTTPPPRDWQGTIERHEK